MIDKVKISDLSLREAAIEIALRTAFIVPRNLIKQYVKRLPVALNEKVLDRLASKVRTSNKPLIRQICLAIIGAAGLHALRFVERYALFVTTILHENPEPRMREIANDAIEYWKKSSRSSELLYRERTKEYRNSLSRTSRSSHQPSLPSRPARHSRRPRQHAVGE